MRLPTPRIFQAHKRPLLAAALLLMAASSAPAQFFGAALEIHYVTADPAGACVARFVTVNTLTANVRGCVNSVWTDLLGGGGGGGLGVAFTTVPFSTEPTYTVSASKSIQFFKITLTANMVSAALAPANATVGQIIGFEICQDATGSRNVQWPVEVVNFGTVDPTASSCSKQAFIWDGTNAVAASVMYSDAAVPALIVNAGALILPQAPTTILGTNSLDTDGTLTANSDTKIATQKAVKAYVDAHTSGTVPGANILSSPSTPGAAPWVASGITVYSGIANAAGNFSAARLLVTSSGATNLVKQPVVLAAGTYRLEVTVKKITGQWFFLAVSDFAAHSFGKFFDLQNGVVGTSNSGGTGAYVSSTITSLGAGWYTITVTGTFSGSITGVSFEMQPAAGDATYSATATHDFYIVSPLLIRTL